MARRIGRALALRPINSFKRIIDTSGALTSGSVSTTAVAAASSLTSADPTGSTQVPIGGRLSAIFYSLYVYSDATEAQVPLIDVYWWKVPSSALTAPTPGATDTSELKRYIIHEEKGLAGNRTTGQAMIIKGVMKIPKVFQRWALGDQLEMRILSSNAAGVFCAKHIYRVIY